MRSSSIAVLAVVVIGACSSSRSDPAVLVSLMGADNSQGGGALTVEANTAYEFPMRNVCTQNGKPIQITKVTPWRPTGSIKIVDWGTRNSRGGVSAGPNIGAEPSTVSKIGGFTTGPVTVSCSDKTEFEQLYVSVSTSTARSTMYGVDLHYGREKIVHNQFAIALCLTKKCPGVSLNGG